VNKGLTFSGLKKLGMEHWCVGHTFHCILFYHCRDNAHHALLLSSPLLRWCATRRGVKAMSPKLFRVYDRHGTHSPKQVLHCYIDLIGLSTGAFTVGRDLVVNEAVSNECFTLVQLSHDSTSGDSIGDDSTAPRQ
jgi:hypothetical protein